MEELKTELKSGYLKQSDYFKKASDVFLDTMKEEKKWLFVIVIIGVINGINLASKNFGVSYELSYFELLWELFFGILSVSILNFFQNRIISKIDKNNELTQKEVITKSIILGILITLTTNVVAIRPIIGIIRFILIFYFLYFKQAYLTKRMSFIQAFERNLNLSKNNRLRMFIPTFLVGLIWIIPLSIVSGLVMYALMYGEALNQYFLIIFALIICLILEVVIFYQRILESIIFLNVEYNLKKTE